MILVDAGYLLAILLPRDELHPQALAWADVVNEPLVVTEYVLCEVVNSLSAPRDRPKVHAALDEIGRSTRAWGSFPHQQNCLKRALDCIENEPTSTGR